MGYPQNLNIFISSHSDEEGKKHSHETETHFDIRDANIQWNYVEIIYAVFTSQHDLNNLNKGWLTSATT